MVENFDTTITEAVPVQDTPVAPVLPPMYPAKHRKPKSKKAAKKALKKTEHERNQLIYINGRLTMENDLLKHMIKLSTAASRRNLDTGMTSNTLRLLPPAGKNREW